MTSNGYQKVADATSVEYMAPPKEFWERLTITELIKAVSDGMTVAIRKTFFPHVLQEVTDKLNTEQIEQFKKQIDIADAYISIIMRKRLKYKLWNTGPVSDGR